MKFFFDNCISPRLARAMHALIEPQHEVRHLRDRYPGADSSSIEDTTWITDLGKERGWIIVSGDIAIRSRPAERAALQAARLTAFFLAKGFTQLDGWEQVHWLIDQWPRIVELADKTEAGSAFLVPKRGKISTF